MALDSKVYFGWKNLMSIMDLDAVPSGNLDANYPYENIRSEIRGRVARFDMTGDLIINLEGSVSDASTVSSNMFVFQGHNLPADATVKLVLYSDVARTTSVYNSGPLPVYLTIPWGEMIAGVDQWGGEYTEDSNLQAIYSLSFDPIEYKAYRIQIETASSFTNDLISVDKVWLGQGWTPTDNIDISSRFGIEDTSRRTKMGSGGQRTDVFAALRTMETSFKYMSDSDRAIMTRLASISNMGGDVVIMADPTAVGYERIVSAAIFQRDNDFNYQQNTIGNNLAIKWREN